jgi:putative two-component system response regulator
VPSIPPKAATARGPRWTGPARRVLIVDDEALILRAATRALKAVGVDVIGTTNPAEGIAILRQEAPDAIVSDLHMPDGCGARFLAEAADLKPSTPRILLSADPDFRPKKGTLREARLFALLSKMEMGRLPRLLVEVFECRRAAAGNVVDPIALATRLARATARPGHEDDQHRERLGRTVALAAQRLGLADAVVDAVRLGAILHDVGQIAVPEHVFARPGSLGANDREFLCEHPTAGARVLEDMPALAKAVPIVLGHHERWDGAGYPHGLAGEDVAISARLFRVADSYDAMRAGRAYRKTRSHEDAMTEILAKAGGELDPEVVRAFASIAEADLPAVG